MQNDNEFSLYTDTIDATDAGMRLDVHLAAALSEQGVSRGKIQKWIKAGLCRVNGEVVDKPKFKLENGQEVSLQGEVPSTGVVPEEGELNILHEDDDLVVLMKPAGLTVHPAPTEPTGTLVNRLVARWPGMADMDSERPGIVHRLDKDTSGLLVVALNEKTRLALTSDFSERRVDKRYLALVFGTPRCKSGTIDLPMGRHPRHKTKMAVLEKGGREARSDYTVVWSSPDKRFSLLSVKIHTGRTHQIRVHLKALGHPIVGDRVYGAQENAVLEQTVPFLARMAPRQMLHAASLTFTHPSTGEELSFIAPPPADFRRLPILISRNVQRVVVTGCPGCGKSTLTSEFAALGAPVLSTDAVVADLYEPGADGWQLLKGRWGDHFIQGEDGPVDKAALFAAMRESDALRREINDMIHPLVGHRVEAFWKKHAMSRYAVAEIPLYFETGWGKSEADVVIGVSTEADMRGERLVSRGVSEELAAVLESWQWSQEDKLARCDIAVPNNSTPEALKAEARRVDSELLALRRRQLHVFCAKLDALWKRGGIPIK